MDVAQIMTWRVACCTPEADLYEAARLMAEHCCGTIPVVERPETMRLVGIITDRDITCRAVGRAEGPLTGSVGNYMSYPVHAVMPANTIRQCMDLMIRLHVRRLPVVDEHGACVGIVSICDLLEYLGPSAARDLLAGVSIGESTSSRFERSAKAAGVMP